jgi:glucosamine--fructose-6-phosphate aminotransferase (isomerizing)
MCGIVGIVSDKKVSGMLLESISKLEYRGYDSVGMVTCSDGALIVKKDIGKISEVHSRINFLDMLGNTGLAHSRWSTHGGVTKKNAHPHTDCSGDIAIVHNGIIENYAELKKSLLEKGHTFASETDTEVIAHLIEENYYGNIKEATLKALRLIEGSYALGVVSSKEPKTLVAARNESPLIVGLGNHENFIASDVPAILNHTKDIIYLNNKELAVLTKDRVDVFNMKGETLEKKVKRINWDAEQAEKQGFKHYMLKEIYEQPHVITKTLEGKINCNKIDLHNERGIIDKEMKRIKRMIIVACGTSWHAGLVGEYMFEELAKLPVEVEYASEFRYRDPLIDKDTLVLAISQSGETADTLAAMREARKKNAKVISIVNVKGSSIDRESDGVLYTKAGPEIGVASTKAFTSQLAVLYLLTIYMGRIRRHLDESQVSERIRDIRRIPAQMQSLLDDNNTIVECAKKYYKKSNALYLGRGINFPIALEGALKLKEVSYVHAEGYPAAEMKHGPIALVDKNMPVWFIANEYNGTYKKVLGNIREIQSRDGDVITVSTRGNKEILDHSNFNIPIPENSYILSSLLSAVPLQLFAYYVAVMRNIDPDKPKNLAKSVTVE